MSVEMLKLDCPHCHAPLEAENNLDTFYCKHCGKKIILDDAQRRKAVLKMEEMNHKKRQLDKTHEMERFRMKHKEQESAKKRQGKLWEILLTSKFFWGIVIAVLVIVFFNVLFFTATKMEEAEAQQDLEQGLIKLPASSENLIEQDYEDVALMFRSAGFTNVRTEGLGDLRLGIFSKEGTVTKVSVNGHTEFYGGVKFPKDAKIVITYHSYPEKGKK